MENESLPEEKQSSIDEALYSRQLYVLGFDAMKKMGTSDVLISGARGLGCEIAKNIVLAGVRSLTIHDQALVELTDLSSAFFLREEDVGLKRAEVTVKRLSELNSYVRVAACVESLTEELIQKFNIIVLTNSLLEEQSTVSEWCRKCNTKLIIADTKGLFGQIFCDFGDEFTVVDANDAEPASSLIANISKDKEGMVMCLDENRHRFVDGDYVTFSDIKGMVELNGCQPRSIKVLGPYAISIGDTTQFGEYINGGIVKQVKMPKVVNFKPFRTAIDEPDFVLTDFAKVTRPLELHLTFLSLHAFIQQYGHIPRSFNKEDAELFLEKVKELNSQKGLNVVINESLMKIFASGATGDLCPMQAVIGGIAAQEVMKACSGKFSPIHQWLYFDAVECLPSNWVNVLFDQHYQPKGTRYDGQIAVFGEEFQHKLESLKYFLVGAGAIGCELLKNWAMMGVSCGELGKVVVTDMDTIEKSNLNRQFLFRPWDIQKPKSLTASLAAKNMNKNIHIEALEDRVCLETEHVFTETFFTNLDGIANALDNVVSRRYVDSKCVDAQIPLLDSGTLGMKGSVQVVVPNLTLSYSSTRDPEQKAIPMCTLKNFPYAIEHTIQWARDQFEGLFHNSAETLRQFLKDRDAFIEQLHKQGDMHATDTLETLKKLIEIERPQNFDDCVAWARQLFEENYSNQIKQLLFNFPRDHVTPSGGLFWTGTKRCPQPVLFDASNECHLNYIVAAANLQAQMFGLPQLRDHKAIASMVSAITLPNFVPREGVKIAVTDSEIQNGSDAPAFDILREQFVELYRKIENNREELQKILPLEFEKDDDTNFHMDFITCASNLRAQNYGISSANKHETKLIAGRIIPAIATTTAVVSGLVCLELYKLTQGHRNISSFKNAFLNLSLPFFAFSEPLKASKSKCKNKEFTLWDRIRIQGEITLKELLDRVQTEYKVNAYAVNYGNYMLYNSVTMSNEKISQRQQLTVRQLVELVTSKAIPAHCKSLELIAVCEDEEGKDVEIPSIKYVLAN